MALDRTPTPWNEILDSHDDPPLTWPLPPRINAEVDLLIQKVASRFSASSLCHILAWLGTRLLLAELRC